MSNRKRRPWPWLNKHPEPPVTTDSQQVLADAQRGLEHAQAERQAANYIIRELRTIRAHNHFGEAIEAAYRGNNHA